MRLSEGWKWLKEAASAVVLINQFLTIFLGLTLSAAISGAYAAITWNGAHANRDTIVVAGYAVIFLLLFISIILFFDRIRTRYYLADMIERAAELSMENSLADKKIFDSLYIKGRTELDKSPKIADLKAAFKVFEAESQRTITHDIESKLSGAAHLYRKLTGRRCAASIQAVEASVGGTMTIECIGRDAQSKDRGFPKERQLHPNDPITHLVQGKSGHFASNDLRPLHQSGQFNGGESFPEQYTSAVIVPISSYQNGKYPTKLLCIDSKKGRLDDRISIALAKYLSNRIAIMYYRLSELDKRSEV